MQSRKAEDDASRARALYKRALELLSSPDPTAVLAAREALEEATSLRHAKAAYQLGVLLTKPPFLDFPSARDALTAAAERGHADAAYQLGRLHEGLLRYQAMELPRERCTPVDVQKAYAAYAISSSLGNAQATWSLASCVCKFTPRNPALVRKSYMDAIRADPGRIRTVCATIFCGPYEVDNLNRFVEAAVETGNWKPLAAELAHMARIGAAGRDRDAECLLRRLLALAS